jgi:hypothetical protein
MLQHITEEYDVESFPLKGIPRIEIFDIGDNHPSTKRARDGRQILVDFDAGNFAVSLGKRLGQMAAAWTDLENLLARSDEL